MPYVTIDQAIKQNPDFVRQNYPQVYSQYVQQVAQPAASLGQTQTSTQATQAEIPGIQAASQQKQIQAQQTASPLNLKADLDQNMPFQQAMGKYTALGMDADAVFKQYLAEKGLPAGMSPQDLQKLGVTKDALGDIGTPGSFMDRYNTQNAIKGLRSLEDQFNTVNTISKIPFLAGVTPTGKAYESARQIFGQHLSSLIPGASGAQQTSQDLLKTLPDVGDATELEPGAAAGQFASVEKQLLATKGYTPEDIGLTPRPQSQPNPQASTPSKAGDILQNALNDISGQAKGLGGVAATMLSSYFPGISSLSDLAEKDPTGTLRQTLVKAGVLPQNSMTDLVKGVGDEYLHATGLVDKNGNRAQGVDDIINNAKEHAQEHPFNTLTDIVGALGAARGIGGGEEAGVPEVPTTPKGPSEPNAFTQTFRPGATKQAGSGIRDTAVTQAAQSGKTIPGDNFVKGIEQWADIARQANPGDEAKIQATVDSVTKQYSGKQINPQDAVKIYNEIDSGYNRAGIQKETIQASRDIALRDLFSNELEKVAPGWQRGTQLIAKGFQSEKSQAGKIVQNLPQNIVKAGLNVGGLGVLKEVLGL